MSLRIWQHIREVGKIKRTGCITAMLRAGLKVEGDKCPRCGGKYDMNLYGVKGCTLK